MLSTSTFFSTYVFSVAPPMVAQLPPSLSQRRHWYVNVVGALLHVPLLVVSVLPSWAVPEIVGGDCVTRGSLRGGRPARLCQAGDRGEQEQRADCGQPKYLHFHLHAFPFLGWVLRARSLPLGSRNNGIWRGFTGRLHLRRYIQRRSGTGPVAQPVFKIGAPPVCAGRASAGADALRAKIPEGGLLRGPTGRIARRYAGRGVARARWPSRSSKSARSCNPRLARFDSGATPFLLGALAALAPPATSREGTAAMFDVTQPCGRQSPC